MNLSENKTKFDVVIIGAGIIGCSIAYFLASKSDGKLKIAVIEKNKIGEEASSGAAGMIAAQIETDSPGPFLDLTLQSRSLFDQLSKELKQKSGVEIEYMKSGISSIAFDEKHEEILNKRLKWQKKAGLDCDWLSSENIRQKFPFLNRKISCGLLAPADGQVSGNRLTIAFAEAAKNWGVNFFEGESVKKLTSNRSHLDFIETEKSKFSAEQFVFATGSWTGELLGQSIPIKPIKGQILIFEIPKMWREKYHWDTPLYIGETEGAEPINCYLVPKKDGHLFLGATMEDCGFNRSENKNASEKMSEYACKIFPELESFPYKGVWTGFRPGSPDGLPILGNVPKFANAYVASGHFRNGILLAPITGKIFSEILMDGKSSFPIDPFSPERFLTSHV